MAKNEELVKLPTRMPKNDREWRDFILRLSQMNIRSGLTSLTSPTGTGYGLGWDEDGNTAFLVGDFDNDKFIRWSGKAGEFLFGSNVVVKQGDSVVFLPFGVQSGEAADGDTITFDPAFPSDVIPKIIFGRGGISYSTDVGSSVNQTTEVRPVNLTNEGFTLSAKIYSTSITLTPVSLSFSGGAGVTSDTVEKTEADESYNDDYTVSFSITVPASVAGEPSVGTVGVYAKSSSGTYTKYASISVANNTGSSQTYSKSKTITVDGLDAGSFFKIQVDEGTGVTLEGTSVTYNTSTVTKYTMTPSGATSIPWTAIGTK